MNCSVYYQCVLHFRCDCFSSVYFFLRFFLRCAHRPVIGRAKCCSGNTSPPKYKYHTKTLFTYSTSCARRSSYIGKNKVASAVSLRSPFTLSTKVSSFSRTPSFVSTVAAASAACLAPDRPAPAAVCCLLSATSCSSESAMSGTQGYTIHANGGYGRTSLLDKQIKGVLYYCKTILLYYYCTCDGMGWGGA